MYQQQNAEWGGLEKFKQALRTKNRLLRTPSESTLFSDYTNQVKLFDYNATKKRCSKIKSKIMCFGNYKCASDKDIAEVNVSDISYDHFLNDNITFGSPFVGCCTRLCNAPHLKNKSSCKSSLKSIPSSTTTLKHSIHTRSLKNNNLLYSSLPNLTSCNSLESDHYSSLKKCCRKNSDDVYSSLIKDYTKKMNRWNSTMSDHYSTLPNFNKNKKASDWNAKTSSSTLTCKRILSKHNNRDYSNMKWQSAKSNIYTDPMPSHKLHKPKCNSKDDLQSLYDIYDKRLREWTDAFSTLSDDSVIYNHRLHTFDGLDCINH